jgi:hypothetical protein
MIIKREKNNVWQTNANVNNYVSPSMPTPLKLYWTCDLAQNEPIFNVSKFCQIF